MVTISIIKLNELQRFNRLDSEYYQPFYLEYYEKLKKFGSVKLGDPKYTKVSDGIHSSIDYDINSKIICLSAMSPRLGYFDLSGNSYISERQHRKYPNSNLREEDIILSSVGTIGNCAVVTKDILPANADRHVGIIRTKKDRLDPFYVCAFLNSKYGRFQTIREATGNVQLNLFIDKMKELLVPLLSPSEQGKIGQLVKESTIMYINSEQKFKQAVQTLLQFVNFSDKRLGHILTYIVDYKTITANNRIDAEFYQPKYDNLLEDIRNFKNGYSFLVQSFPLSNSRVQSNKKSDEEFTYVELADVNGSVGTIDEKNIILGRNAPSRAKMSLKKGDVIVSSVSGSFDKVALISDEFDKSVGSTGFFVFRPKNGFSEFLLALVKSPLVQLQLQKYTTGSILSAVPKPILKKIQIPDFPHDKQKLIADMVKESHQMFSRSRKLMKDAITKVEGIIEN